MANIKNFGLVGVGSDVQFGKSGPRLINDAGIFKFKKADGIAMADAQFASVTAETLKNSVGKLVTVDATGKLIMGADIESLATDLEVSAAVAAERLVREAAEQAISDAVTAEVTRAKAAEAANKALVEAEEARALAAESALQTAINDLETAVTQDLQDAIDAEILRATNEEARIEGLVAAEKTRAEGEETRIAGLVATEKSRAEAAEAALQAALTAETDARVAADSALQTSLTAELERAQAAEAALSGRITTEVADRVSAINTVSTAIANEAAARESADDAFQIALDAEITARAQGDADMKAQLEAAIAGLTWENPVDAIVTVLPTEGLVDGQRYVFEGKIYTVVSGSFDGGEVLVEGAAFFDKETDVPYVFNGTAAVQFNGAAGITAGAGLVKNGNTLSVVSSSGTITVTEDSIDVAQSVLDSISTVATNLSAEVARATLAEEGLGQRIDDEIAAREAAILAEHEHHEAGDAALQVAIDAEVTRATAAELALSDALAVEVARAEDAESALSALISANTDGIAGLVSDLAAEVSRAEGVESGLLSRMTAVENKNTNQDGRLDALEAKTAADSGLLQAEVDAMELALGLESDGTFAGFGSTNYIATDDAFALAIGKIDAALKAMDVAYKAADAIVLSDAADYTDGREVSILAYVDGQVSMLTSDIATAKAEAIAAAATDATTKANNALSSSKAYTDSQVAQAVVEAQTNVARAIYASFSGADAVIGMVKGFVHRIKVYMNVAGSSDSAVQVGTMDVNNDVTTTADVDSSVAGLYTVEVNKMYGTDTQLSIFVGDVAAAGTVVVEYLA
jgi:hypothetical protein